MTRVCLLIILSSLLVASATAQDPPPPYIRVVKVQLHADRAAHWIDARKVMRDAIKKGGGGPFNVWQVVSGNTSEYWVGTPMASFAAMDEGSVAAEVLGEAEWERLLSRVRPAIKNREVVISRFLANHSIIPEDTSPPAFIVVTHRLNAPGKRRDISRYYLDKILPEMKKAGVEAHYMYATFSGGDPRQTSFVEPMEKWADLDEPNPLYESLGDKTGDLMFPFWSMFRAEERIILRHRPDLSYRP